MENKTLACAFTNPPPNHIGECSEPTLWDPICASYRTQQHLISALQKFLEFTNQEIQCAVVGQRRDMERFSRFTYGQPFFPVCMDTWIPLNTYSALPNEELLAKLKRFSRNAISQNRKPVLLLEASGHIKRWNNLLSEDVIIWEWVRWAQENHLPIFVLFYRPIIDRSDMLSLLQPFPWIIIKGKFWNNHYHISSCQIGVNHSGSCQKSILHSIEHFIKSRNINQELLNSVARMLHYYLGPQRVKMVSISLHPHNNASIPTPRHYETFDCFPLNFPDYPDATLTIVWNQAGCKYPTDDHTIFAIIECLSQQYQNHYDQLHLRRLQGMMDKITDSCHCYVLGMQTNGTLSIINGRGFQGASTQDLLESLPPEWVEHAYQTFMSGQPLFGHEVSITHPTSCDSIVFWAEGHVIDDATDDLCGIIILHDITQKKKLERSVLQIQKEDSVRVMSGGITHDLNNVLSAVMGYASHLSMKLAPEDPLREDLSMIEKATGRAADLIRRLLGFSRQSKRPTGLVDPNQICEEVANLLKPSFNGSIKTHLELDPDVWPIIGDANQIEQAVMNLCLNAKDALGKGGTVTITTENRRIGRNHAGFKSVKPGIYTEISISDNGPGIPKNLRKKIFEPFYTTKLSGKGTGLGLTMVKMIADNHGGYLKLRSRKNKGATFSLMFRAAPKTQQVMDLVQKSKRGGKEGVLVVDDEPSILDMGAKILKDSGYHVFTAATISEAEQMLIQHVEDIDLAIMDIIFPENNGIECCHTLKGLSPKLKFVLFSGYPQETCPVSKTEMKQFPFVQKPFRASELLDAVRRTLDHNP